MWKAKSYKGEEQSGPKRPKYLCGPGLAVYSLHGFGAGVDSMCEFLLHVSVGLRYFPNAEEGKEAHVRPLHTAYEHSGQMYVVRQAITTSVTATGTSHLNQ